MKLALTTKTHDEQLEYLIDRVALAICEAEIGGALATPLGATESADHWRLLAATAIKAMLTSGMVEIDYIDTLQ